MSEPDPLKGLTGRRSARPTSRSMSDLLSLPEAHQQLMHWMMRKGEVLLEQVVQERSPDDPDAAQEMLAALARDGFIQEIRLGGISHYRARLQTRPGRQLPRSVWQALYDKLTDVFDHEGELVELGGNQPLRLDGSDAVWLVRTGEANAFGVRLRDGEPVGAREYQLSAAVGQALLGLGSSSGADVGLVVLGTSGTTLRRLDRARLQELAGEARHSEQVTGLLTDWVVRLQNSWPVERTPQTAEPLHPGQHLTLLQGRHARTAGGVLWVGLGEGRVHLAGRGEISVSPDSSRVPVSGDIWLTADTRAAQLTVSDAAAWVAEDRQWRAVDTLHELALRALAEHARTESDRQRQRLTVRARADRASVTGAVLRMAAVLDRQAAEAAQAADEGDDPLLSACRTVGGALGIAIHPPARSERAQPGSDPLDRIARASRIRTRQVILRGAWWRDDNGPLVAYRQDGRPLALLPDARGRYFAVDPATPQRVPVTAGLAETLDPKAYVLYRAFPGRALKALDLVRFGLRGAARDQAGVLLYGVGGGLVALLTPVLTGVLFNSVIPSAQRSSLVAIVAALVLAAATTAIFQFTRSVSFLRAEGKMAASVQSAVWDRMLALPVTFFRDYSSGDLAARAMGIDAIRQLLTGSVTGALLAGIFSVFSWLLLFYYDWQLALIATLLGLVVVAVTFGGGLIQLRHQRRMYDIQGKLSGLVVQLITGMPKLRVAGAERRALGVWARAFALQETESKDSKLSSLPAFEAAYPTAATLIIFGLVAAQGAGTLSIGAFLAFIVALNQFLTGLLLASKAATVAMQAVPYYERSRPLLETRPELDEAKVDPGELSGEIEISHASFRYAPDLPPVLQDVSLNVRAGQFIAIVGPSGNGKSTVFRLLLGFERPEAGAIFYDGQEIGSLDLRALRRQIGVVMQNSRLQPGDLFANIAGTSQHTLQDAWEAARMVGLDEDIKGLPMGMQTFITDSGSTLSGGQRQRLMIARAVINRPRVLLFDEATSALDNRTQAIISHSLEQLRATRVVIAHRLSTVINADCIYVLSQGRFVQSGTYEELMAQPGLFRDLARRQLD